MKDLEKQNEEITFLLYMSIFAFLIVLVVAIVFINKSNQYEKDIVMIVKDVVDRQHSLDVWEDFNRSYIPETALPRIKEIEAIYLEG